ncbi:MAG: ABC-2 type transport system ATP-binding protein [Chloroflexi bacterium]|nr:MAG: ABC-2 type transport system ATP-binding protein [Chloroflexota bacterium]
MASERDPVIVVEGLIKRFDDLTAIDGVSFNVPRGEVFGILGPNGAGKTTTLECIEGLLNPTQGSIRVLGMDVPRQAREVKERIGIQLQASSYFDYLTLREILQLFQHFYPRHIAVDDLLERMDLTDKAGTTVKKLSGGQKQRFSIAATLLNDPELVFLDEPTTGLDPQARRNLWDLIQEIHSEGRTVVLTTHYMEEAERLCDRVAIMDQGKIVAMDTPQNLVRSLPTPYEIKVVVKGSLSQDGLETLDSVVNVRAGQDGGFAIGSTNAARTLPALLAWAGREGSELEHLEVQPSNLEDVFLSLTGRGLRD